MATTEVLGTMRFERGVPGGARASEKASMHRDVHGDVFIAVDTEACALRIGA